jgi:tetratricopeptide (TPR) repeat protein
MLRAEWELAQANLERVLEIRQQVGHVAGIVDAYIALGRIAECHGSLEDAREAYGRAVSVADGMDAAPCGAAAHRRLGLLLLRDDETTAGTEHIGRAIALAQDIADSLEYGPALLAQALLRMRSSEFESALASAERALTAPRPVDFEIEARAGYAEILLGANMLGEAEAHATAAIRMAEGLGAPMLLGTAYRSAGLVADRKGDRAAAAAFLQTASQYFQSARAPREHARAAADYQRAASSGSSPATIRSGQLPYSR